MKYFFHCCATNHSNRDRRQRQRHAGMMPVSQRRWSSLLLILLVNQWPLAAAQQSIDAPLLNNLASNLYAEFRQHGRTPSQHAKQAIRRRIDEFIRQFRGGDDGKAEQPNEEANGQKRTKRDAFGYRSALVDSSAYTLSGFQENGTVPIEFPVDLCLFDVNNVLFAAALHQPAANVFNETHLRVFRNFGTWDAFDLRPIFNYTERSAQAMDCVGIGNVGYFALAIHVDRLPDKPIVTVTDGSPVFQLTTDGAQTKIEVVQYFNELHLNRVYLMTLGPELYFFQSFACSLEEATARAQAGKDEGGGGGAVAVANANCLIYRWSGYHFDLMDELPCTNAMQIQPFFVRSDMYVAIANYRDANDQIDTFSVVYKYSVEHSKFVLFQRLRSHAAVDIKYFELAAAGKIERFIVVANSYANTGRSNDSETHSIIYKYVNDYFTPFQSILLSDVMQFLPILGPRGEFALMIACANQPTKVWLYNGWNFEESAVQFTGGALGSGVQRLRNYALPSGIAAVVVANTHMLMAETNVYVPLYAVRQSGAFVSSSQDWCAEAMYEIGTQPVEQLLADVQAMQDAAAAEVHVEKALQFQKVRGERLTTQAVQTKKLRLDEALAERLRQADEEVARLEERVQRLEERSRKKERKHRVEEPQVGAIADDDKQLEELHVDELTIGSTLNGQPIERLVHANRPLQVSSLKAQRVFIKSQTLYDTLMSKRIARDAAADQQPSSSSADDITADSLTVDGLINGIDLNVIAQYALRLTGDQELHAQFNINHLKCPALHVDTNIVSERKLSTLVRIAAGTTNTVQQAVRFEQPALHIAQLFVGKRMNNLLVANGTFDVLRQNAVGEQHVTGHKRIAAATLLSPIELRGKIAIGGDSLAEMNPLVTHAEDVVVSGDFVISGNVTVKRVLRAFDVHGKASSTSSVQRLLAEGLRLDADVVPAGGVQLEFGQPLRAGNLIVGRVNGLETAQWARAGEIQEITGTKTFAGDLRIRDGYCDALAVNRVPLQWLNETTLKRTGDQTITGRIHVRRALVDQHSTDNLTLRERAFTDYLNGKDQIVPGNVTVRGDLIVHNAAQIQNMRTGPAGGFIDGFDVLAMLADTIAVGAGGVAQTIEADLTTFGGNVTFGEVHVGGNVLGLGTMAQLQAHVRGFEETIELEGPREFAAALFVDELIVAGRINGMAGDRFGHEWLLTEGEQNFTAPQTMRGIETEQLWQGGYVVNGLDVKAVSENCVRLSDDVTVAGAVQFDAVTVQQPLQVAGPISGLAYPDDIILNQAQIPQDLSALRQITGHLSVSGRLNVRQTVNDVNLNRLRDFASAEPEFALHILGGAEFETEPHVALLNGVNVAELLQTAWLADENVLLTGSGVYVDQAMVDNGITVAGTFNGKSVEYLRDKYVSLSRPQEIYAHAIFGGGNVLVNGIVSADRITQRAPGLVRDQQNAKTAINVTDFCANALRHGIDQQITGLWEISEAIIHDNLESRINGLDFRTDVLRHSLPEQQITALKHFDDAIVENIVCQNGGRLQDVNVGEWISRAVFADGNNYTIQGTVVLENATVFGDLRVFGHLNDRTVSPETILLRVGDQEIRGNVEIRNNGHADDEQAPIRPLTIHEANVANVNGVAVNEFLSNVVPRDAAAPRTMGALVFERPPTVGRLYSTGAWTGVSIPGVVERLHENVERSNYTDLLGEVHRASEALVHNLESRPRHLSGFRLLQTLDDRAFLQVTAIRITTDSNVLRTVYATIVQSQTINAVHFYRWNRSRAQLELDTDLKSLHPAHMRLDRISVATFYDRDYLIVECTDSRSALPTKLSYLTYFRQQFRIVYESYHNASQQLCEIQLPQRSCLGFFAAGRENEIRIECALISEAGDMLMEPIYRLVAAPVPLVQALWRSDAAQLLALDVLGGVQVWRQTGGIGDVAVQFEHVQTLRTSLGGAASSMSVTRYRGALWLAVCVAKAENATTHFGSVEVYRSTDDTYEPVQAIDINQPLQAEIATVATSGELIIYALTKSLLRPFVVYKYTGVTQFRPFFEAATLPAGRRFTQLRRGAGDSSATRSARNNDLIAVLSTANAMNVIESVLN